MCIYCLEIYSFKRVYKYYKILYCKYINLHLLIKRGVL